MDKIEKWSKQAYLKGLDLEDVAEKNERDISALKNDIEVLETAVAGMGAGTGDNRILLYSVFSGKIPYTSATATSKFICNIESEENGYTELRIDFGVFATTAGTSGNALIEVLLDEDVICSKIVSFIEKENQIEIVRYIYGTGEEKPLYLRCTCLSADGGGVAIPFYLKDIKFTLKAEQPYIMEHGYSTLVEQVTAVSAARASNLYFFSIDGVGLHIKEYVTSIGVTNVLDSASTGRCGLGLTADVDEMKSFILHYKDSSGNYTAFPACIRHYVIDENHLQQVPVVSTVSLIPGEYWTNYTLAELNNNTLNWGVNGVNTSASLQYRALVLGYTTTGASNVRVQGFRIYGFSGEGTVFDLDCPISVVRAFYHVANIWNNAENYSTMVIFQDESDDLYFQAYSINSGGSAYLNWLDKTGACTKIGNGTRCSAYYENGTVRFYYIRGRKIYTVTLTLSTRAVSAETFVAEGQYYKETEGFYVLRNNGIITYTAKPS